MPINSTRLIDVVHASLDRARLRATDRMVVGLSGGVDSQTLAHSLATLRDRGEAPELLLVHVDHQLRPNSNLDARAVERVARMLGVPLEIKQVDVEQWSVQNRHGIEAGARAARYAALTSAARDWGTSWVAVGHNLEDQVETVILRLTRGSSPDGLAGMRELSNRDVVLDPAASERSTIRLLRPLLTIRRNQIEAYAAANHLSPIVDQSNFDRRFRRNAIRHEVIPLLERVVPGASGSIARNAELLASDADYLTQLALEGFQVCCEPRGSCIRLNRATFRDFAPPLQRRIVLQAVRAVASESVLARERVEAVRAAIVSGAVSHTIEVGGGISAFVDYEIVMVGTNDAIASELRLGRGLPEIAPGSVAVVRGSTTIQAGLRWEIVISVAQAQADWELRTRRPGDRIMLANGSQQRLQDWMVNQKVPSYTRDYLPLLVQNGVIRWAAGISTAWFQDVDSGLVARLVERPWNDCLDDK
ncbi:MAG TPA: tRNA lysidine(34) synthetase TilS [Nitrolancea sp.]|nr:tRNA lysidine(34) synthetase TilS [Nitrolancea sp.]